LDSVQRRDYPAIQGVVLLSGTVVVITNAIVDFTYPILDPRIRSTKR